VSPRPPAAPRRGPVLIAGLAALSSILWGCGAPAPPPPRKAAARPVEEGAPTGAPSLRTGDLLFLDLDCGETCEAIEAVTKRQYAVRGPSLSHVGIVSVDGAGRAWLLEAWPGERGRRGGVVRTPIAEVLSRVSGGDGEPGGYSLLRPTADWSAIAARAARVAERLLGAPYDEAFLPNNEAYYCAELVQQAFKAANGAALFPLLPMEFGPAGSPARAMWERYYRRLGMAVPEGKPGSSPLGLYLFGLRTRMFERVRLGSAR
jgi:hypothetical protein